MKYPLEELKKDSIESAAEDIKITEMQNSSHSGKQFGSFLYS